MEICDEEGEAEYPLIDDASGDDDADARKAKDDEEDELNARTPSPMRGIVTNGSSEIRYF